MPYHRLWNQKYAIYWRLTDEAGWQKLQAERRTREQARAVEATRQAALEARRIDWIDIGDAASEKAHGMTGPDSRTGALTGRRWRDAAPGGWFEYRLKVRTEAPVRLLATYWGSDGGRTFDILIDGHRIATQKLEQNRPNAFFDVEYEIPAELTDGKESVVVRFAGRPGSITGGLFACATLRAKP